MVDRSSGRAAPPGTDSRSGFYTVKKGDTLYSIALDNGQNYRDVAAWNNIDNPNMIRVGQSLRVAPPAQPVEDVSAGVIKPIKTSDVEEVRPVGAATAPSPVAAASAVSPALKQEPKAGKQPYSDEAWARAAAQRNCRPRRGCCQAGGTFCAGAGQSCSRKRRRGERLGLADGRQGGYALCRRR